MIFMFGMFWDSQFSDFQVPDFQISRNLGWERLGPGLGWPGPGLVSTVCHERGRAANCRFGIVVGAPTLAAGQISSKTLCGMSSPPPILGFLVFPLPFLLSAAVWKGFGNDPEACDFNSFNVSPYQSLRTHFKQFFDSSPSSAPGQDQVPHLVLVVPIWELLDEVSRRH